MGDEEARSKHRLGYVDALDGPLSDGGSIPPASIPTPPRRGISHERMRAFGPRLLQLLAFRRTAWSIPAPEARKVLRSVGR